MHGECECWISLACGSVADERRVVFMPAPPSALDAAIDAFAAAARAAVVAFVGDYAEKKIR